MDESTVNPHRASHDLPDTVDTINTLAALDRLSLEQVGVAREKLERIVDVFNVTHNSKLRVNTVSKDILYNIFVFSVFTSNFPANAILSISQVCRHWRQVSLNSPILWGFMDLSQIRISKIFLERSADAPLHLVISETISPFRSGHIFRQRWYWRRNLHLIPSLLSRVKHLTIRLDVDDVQTILPFFSDSPALLRLRSLDFGFINIIKIHVGDQSLVPGLLLHPDSRLKTLVLENAIVPWGVPSICSLVTLIIVHPGTPPTIEQLMSLLSASPGLEELELKGVFVPELPSGEPTLGEDEFKFNKSIIQLPHLVRLWYFMVNPGCLPYFEALSRHIRTPSLKVISIDTYYLKYSSLVVAPLPRLLLPKTTDTFATLKHLYICLHTGNHTYIILGHSSHGSQLALLKPEDLDLTLKGRYLPSNDITDTGYGFLADFLRAFRGVQRLELERDAWNLLDPRSGIDLASIMPQLSILEILPADYLLDGLFPDATPVLETLIPCRNFPLRTITLRSVRFDHKLMVKLVSTTGIRCVQLDECLEVEPDQVALLRDLGATVNWSEEMTRSEREKLMGGVCDFYGH